MRGRAGGGQGALEGDRRYQASGEAKGAVEEGQEPGSIVDGGRDEDVRWTQASDGLVDGLTKDPHRAPFFSEPSATVSGGPVRDPHDLLHPT